MTLKLNFMPIILASIVIGVVVFAGDPFWQFKDDAYYAMLGDGYGVVKQPITEIPYMHPLVGQAVSILRALGVQFGYATYLYFCLWLGGIAIAYRFLKSRGWIAAFVALVAGIIPVALLPQYTTVAGFLVASTAVLWMTEKEAVQPTVKEWIYGLVLIFLASLFRIEMVVLAIVCLSPVLLVNAYKSGWFNRPVFFQLAAGLLVVWLSYFLTNFILNDPQMSEFYLDNKPRGMLLDYGYGSALSYTKVTLPQGISTNDLGLLNSWFFAYVPIIKLETLNELINQVSFQDVLRQRYWEAASYIKKLPTTIFFWVTLASMVLAFLSRHRYAILSGIALFTLADVAFSLLQKPFPERVALGIALGFFLLALLTIRQNFRANKHGIWAVIFATCLLIPVTWNIVTDRIDLISRSQQFEKDFSFLRGNDVVYAWVGQIPLRIGFRPFQIMNEVPQLVFLGSMYMIPQVMDSERSRACGGFIKCLVSGVTLKLVASEDQVQQLDILLREHYSKVLVTLDKKVTSSFTLHTITVKDIHD
jgi:hypothetical protein